MTCLDLVGFKNGALTYFYSPRSLLDRFAAWLHSSETPLVLKIASLVLPLLCMMAVGSLHPLALFAVFPVGSLMLLILVKECRVLRKKEQLFLKEQNKIAEDFRRLVIEPRLQAEKNSLHKIQEALGGEEAFNRIPFTEKIFIGPTIQELNSPIVARRLIWLNGQLPTLSFFLKLHDREQNSGCVIQIFQGSENRSAWVMVIYEETGQRRGGYLIFDEPHLLQEIRQIVVSHDHPRYVLLNE